MITKTWNWYNKLSNIWNLLLNHKIYSIVFKIVLGIGIIFTGAQISLPLKPVPVTFTTVSVTLIALLYTPYCSFITVLLYMLAGLIGIPVFANFNSGLDYLLLGPAGYCLGMLIAAPVMSFLKGTISNKLLDTTFCSIAGHLIIYFFGIIWLSNIISLEKAIYSGFIIFIPTGILKIIFFSLTLNIITNQLNPK